MMVRIAIIGSLLVILTGAAVVAVIFMNRADRGPEPDQVAAVTAPSARPPAPTAPALPLPDPPQVIPLPPEPVFREPPDPVAPVSRYTSPPPLAEPAPPVPRRKPPPPMAVEPVISAPSPPPPRVARPAQPVAPVQQPEAPIARTDPVPSDRADRDLSTSGAAIEQPAPTGAYQPWTPAPDAAGPAKTDPPPPYRPDSPAETAALPPPEPVSPTMPAAPAPSYRPDPPAETEALPPPEPVGSRQSFTPVEPSRIDDPSGTSTVTRYQPWTSPRESTIAEKPVPLATPEPASPAVSVALPPPQPDDPPALPAAPAPETASPIITAALPPLAPEPSEPVVSVAPRQPPPAADTSDTRQASRYESWTPSGTPSGAGVRDDTQKPRTPGKDLLASINPTLERVPCAVLTASVEGGTVKLWGAVRNRPDLQQVKSTLMNMRDVTGVRTTVRQMSRAQCELVNLFSPYISANRRLDQRISVKARTPEAQYEEYDNLVLDLGSPGRDGYVYVDYYALDGSVVHLIPSSALPTNRMRAGSARRLGDRPANGEWMIGKPLGLEMIVALSSTTPLFTARREEVESAEIYLLDLQNSLKRVPDNSAGAVVADIVFIKTVPIR